MAVNQSIVGVLVCFLCVTVAARDSRFDLANIEFTTVVKAKSDQCFYQHAAPRQTLRLEFRVIDSGFVSLDINKDLKISLYVRSPKKKTVIEENKKTQAIRNFKILEEGDYEFCLDNTFSHLSSKTVYFEVSIDVDSEYFRWSMMNEELGIDNKNNDTISRLKRTANKVKDDLERIKHYQDTLRVVEARDLHIQEKNLTKVNAFSSLTTVCMMLVGGLHLFAMKSMFNNSSVLCKLFRKIG